MQPDITPQQIADATKLLADAQKMREAEKPPTEEGSPAIVPFVNK